MMGGDLSYQEADRGSTFRLLLPREMVG
jgi:hypothetical protein